MSHRDQRLAFERPATAFERIRETLLFAIELVLALLVVLFFVHVVLPLWRTLVAAIVRQGIDVADAAVVSAVICAYPTSLAVRLALDCRVLLHRRLRTSD